MQAYANVASIPVQKTTKTSGRVYWEFRAAESSKGEDKDPTWYTVRLFKDERLDLAKGDFVVFTGKLKNDVFMSRDGKPMGVLTVMAFNLAKVGKGGSREEIVADSPAGKSKAGTAHAQTQPTSDTSQGPKATSTLDSRTTAGDEDSGFVWLIEP